MYPERTKAENFNKQEYGPKNRAAELGSPEKCLIYCIRGKLFVEALESPDFLSFLIIIAPPPESNKQPSSDILNGPKIKWAQNHDTNKGNNFRSEHAHKQVT